jgi:hypothetical protein
MTKIKLTEDFKVTKTIVEDGAYYILHAGTILEGEEVKEWPEAGDRYYYITFYNGERNIGTGVFDTSSFDKMLKEENNLFKTEAEAQLKIEAIRKVLADKN